MSEAVIERPFSGGTVQASVRVEPAPVLAGGPCWLAFRVSVDDTTGPLYLAAGIAPQPGRSGDASISASLDGPLDDVATDTPALVGPSGAVPVEPGQPYQQRLLVNQYVRLEECLERLEPGGHGILSLTFRRPFPLATDFPTALTNPHGETIDLRVDVEIHRDDDALATVIDELAETLRRNWRDATSNEVEDAVRALVALRLPQSRDAIAAFSDHPLALVREAAAAARTA